MRLNRADDGRWRALDWYKIKPAPRIHVLSGQAQYLVGNRIGLTKIIKEPASQALVR